MSIFKVAESYRKLLTIASNQAYQMVAEVRKAAKDLCQPNIRALWMNAADPYSDDDVKLALNSIDQNSLMYYDAAFNKGMTSQQHATYLTNLHAALERLQGAGLASQLDPTATNKEAAFRASLEKATSSYVPSYLPAYNKPVTQQDGSGIAHRQDGPGASEMALDGVVHSLVEQDYPEAPEDSRVDWKDYEQK